MPANLDVRSYMMDTNNGVLIRGAPSLRDAYTAFVDAQLADPRTVTDLGASLRETSLEEVKSGELRRLSDFVGALSPAKIRALRSSRFRRRSSACAAARSDLSDASTNSRSRASRRRSPL